MGQYGNAARYYDLIYSDKDYDEEADTLAALIRSRVPEARQVLDVACGTGQHARVLADRGFELAGVDIEPAFVEIASKKIPEGSFELGDMTDFDLGREFDAVVCLFSAVGYTRDEDSLRKAVSCMARHVRPGGALIVEPWFQPDQLTSGYIHTEAAQSEDGLHAVRMSRTVVEGAVTRLEFEYLIGSARGLERLSEVHELGNFTRAQMEGAFVDAGLDVELLEGSLRKRGLYVGSRPQA